jgi:hypothetical protein
VIHRRTVKWIEVIIRPPLIAMMLRAPCRPHPFAVLLFLCGCMLAVRVPAQVSFQQQYHFRQTGESTLQPVRFTVAVSSNSFFAGGAPPATGRLSGSATTLDLAVQGPTGGYSGSRSYESEAAMRRDFPSGTYVLTIGTSSTSYVLDLSATVTPPRITTWSALQEWDGGPMDITWTPLSAVLPGAGFGLSLGNSEGEARYYPFGMNTAIGSIGRSSELPAARQATFNITSTHANGIAIYGLSGPVNKVAGEWTGRLAVIANGGGPNPGAFAVVPSTPPSGSTLWHTLEALVEFPVRRLPLPPKIQTRPTDRTVNAGSSTGFFVSATGGDLTYQWYRNGAPLPGRTEMSFSIQSVQASDAGDYHAVVTNAFGSAPTPSARLALASSTLPPSSNGYGITATSGPPVITRQPEPVTVLNGETFLFRIGVSGQQPFSFQWHHNGEPVSGGNSPSYSVLPAVPRVAGRYKVTVQNPLGSVTSDEVDLIVLPPPRITNLSVRATAGAGAGDLTIGFNVGRRVTDSNLQGGQSVTVVLRGIGPGLNAFGISNALSDPQFAIYSGSTLVAENDDWGGAPNFAALMASVGAFTLTPGSKDAALFHGLGQGNHTVRISGTGGASGVVLGEIYDSTRDENFPVFGPRLTNVSALSRTGTGADTLSAGFVIGGSGTRTVLIRGVGPGLAAVGVGSGFVRDPRLVLYGRGGAALNGNDDWAGTTTLRNAFASVGAFALPDDSRDAALVAILPAGSYTVEVSSADNSTGLALIEVYEIP